MKSSLQTILLESLKPLMRPVVRYCLRHTIKLQEIIEGLKVLLLEEAVQKLSGQSERINASRLSIMTGVHRKDVIRILERKEIKRDSSTLSSRIVAHWQSNAAFKGISGKPKALSYEGAQSEFAELVRTVSKELNPYTVLFEFERMGIIKKNEGRVQLMSPVYDPQGNVKESLGLLAVDSNDLFEAVTENVFEAPKIPNLHLTTEYDNIAPDAAPEIRRWFLQEGAVFQKKANEYLAQFDVDANQKMKGVVGGMRVVVSTFSKVFEPK